MAAKLLRKLAEFPEPDRQPTGRWPILRTHLNGLGIEPRVYLTREDSIAIYVHARYLDQAKRLLSEVMRCR
jgi:hypothetical protein